MSFADTLMDLLMDEKYSKIVTFLPDDHSWGIANAKVFADEVMPKVFGIRTFSSFVRKLNRWGFERIMEKKTHDIDVFRHVNFRKGDWAACRRIKCIGRLAKFPSTATPSHNHLQTRVVTPPLAGLKRSLSAASYSPEFATVAAPPSLFPSVSTGSIMGHSMAGPALAQIRRDEIELEYLAQRRAEILARKYGLPTQHSLSSRGPPSASGAPLLFY